MSRSSAVQSGARIAVLTLLAPIAPALAELHFAEVALDAGVRFQQRYERVVPYGGGAVWADFDEDGALDLFAVQAVGCNRLFRGLGDGTFRRVEDAAGADVCALVARGAAAADYDNDGDQDLYLAAFGQNRLLENRLVPEGALRFVDVTVLAAMTSDGGGNSGSASWGDYDGDGRLDLFVTNHSARIPPQVCGDDLLWHNEGDGTFTEVAARFGIARSGQVGIAGCGLAATWSDYDDDGDLDLLVVNDFGLSFARNRLFRNDGRGPKAGDWQFTDVSVESGFDYAMFGMGISTGDIDRDGDLDYYMSDIGPNDLAINDGDGRFTEVAALVGVEASDVDIYGASGLVSWGSSFTDLDLDGWEDLVVANGGSNQDDFEGMFGYGYVNENPNYVYRNRGDGTFIERHEIAGLAYHSYHRSLAVADYDGDGDVDLHFGVHEGPNALYRNDQTSDARWLKVEVVGTVGDRDAIGTRVRLRAAGGEQQREVDGGSSFLSSHERTLHFGLGEASRVDRLQARFLSGVRLELRDLPVDRTLELIEPEASLIADDLDRWADGRIEIEAVRHLPGAATYDVWIERGALAAEATAGERLFGTVLRIEVGADRRVALSWPSTDAPTGTLVVKLGTYPDRVIHRLYLDG